MSPSEHRLHPIALLVFLAKQVRDVGFAVVAALLVLRSGSDAAGVVGQAIGPLVGVLVLLGPSIAKLITFRYSYEADELVIRWGWLHRKVRHIPFARIQSLDAREMLLHRWTGTVAVKIETGGGAELDGDIPAIPRTAFEEMRQRIVPGSSGPRDEAAGDGAPTALLAELGTRDLLLAGLINNRGMILVTGLVAVGFEWGFGDRLLEWLFGSGIAEQGTTRTLLQLLRGSIEFTPHLLMVIGLGILGFLLIVRFLSLVFTVLRFHDHRLISVGNDLRASCGLLTRTTSTTPLRRIQSLTIREGPWHRLAGRVTIHATTAGGNVFDETVASRETLTPLLPRERVPELVRIALSGAELPEDGWHVAAAASRGRVLVRWVAISAVLLGLAWWVGMPALLLASMLVLLGLVASLGRLSHFAWNAFEGGLAMRSGWMWRRTTIIRHDRVQLAMLAESPFDRRHGMARVMVDSAGAAAPLIKLTWLTRHDAAQLVARLDAEIAATEFTL